MSVPDVSAGPSFTAFTAEAVRAGYDGAAARYAEMFADSLREYPVERGLLAGLAELVQANGGGPVADLGCGPGYVTAHLSSLGLTAFGVDLSPVMIELARAAHPGLRFEVGSMDALNVADGSLGGAVSRSSIIHLPPERLPVVVGEFSRVLAPGGYLLISFGEAEAAEDHTFYDHSVTGAYCWRPDYISDLLLDAGLVERSRTLTRPEATAKRQFSLVQLLARKSDN